MKGPVKLERCPVTDEMIEAGVEKITRLLRLVPASTHIEAKIAAREIYTAMHQASPIADCDHYKLVSGGDGPWTCVQCGAVDPERPKYRKPASRIAEGIVSEEVVERVAKALWEHEFGSEGVWPINVANPEDWFSQARAAIAALHTLSVGGADG